MFVCVNSVTASSFLRKILGDIFPFSKIFIALRNKTVGLKIEFVFILNSMKNILFIIILSSQLAFSQNVAPKIVVIDTVELSSIIHPETQFRMNPASKSFLFINEMFAWIEICDTFPQLSNEFPYAIINFENGKYGIKQFYSIDSMKAVPVFVAYKENPAFVQFVVKSRFTSLNSPSCHTAYGNSKLFVQFDMDYSDSIGKVRGPYWEKRNWYKKKPKHYDFQDPDCRIVVYKNGQESNTLYFQADSFKIKPIGMAVYQNKYLIAGYDTYFLKGYERVSDKYYYIIDTESEMVVNMQNLPYIYSIFEHDGFLYQEYYKRRKGKETHVLLKCIIE